MKSVRTVVIIQAPVSLKLYSYLTDLRIYSSQMQPTAVSYLS